MQLSVLILVVMTATACGYSYTPYLFKKTFHNFPYKGGYYGNLPFWSFGGGMSLGLRGLGYGSYAFGSLGGGVLAGGASFPSRGNALGVGSLATSALGNRGFRGSVSGGLGSWTSPGFFGPYGYPYFGYRYRFGDDRDFDFDFDFD